MPTEPFQFIRHLLGFGLLLPLAVPAAVIEGRVALPVDHAVTAVNKRYEVVSKGGTLSVNPPVAVVYIAGSFSKHATPPVARMLQKDLLFVPALLPVQVGTKVEFPNLDDTYHNVFSYSPAKRFDLGRYRPDEVDVPTQVFDTAGLVTVRCDIHEHMRALILVLDTPHFVVTAGDGTFRLEHVPPGHYKLKAWLDSRTVREHSVEVPAENTVLRVDFP